MEAHLITLNDFNMPTVLKESSAAYVHIIYLLYLEPGTFQSHPDMGVGIISRYRFNNDENMLFNLEEDIKKQISTYLPWIQYVEIKCGILNNHKLGIIINTESGAYTVAYNKEDNSIETAAIYILDQLYK